MDAKPVRRVALSHQHSGPQNLVHTRPYLEWVLDQSIRLQLLPRRFCVIDHALCDGLPAKAVA